MINDEKIFLLLKQLNIHGLNNWKLTDDEIRKLLEELKNRGAEQ